MTPRARRFIAWLLLFALALSSAAPSFASRASAEDLAALGICSLAAHQAGYASSDGQPLDYPAPLGSALYHCPLCAPAAHAVLPIALPRLPVPAAGKDAFGVPRIRRPEPPVYAGSMWCPRGPPLQA
jgi:hypothetical protein